MRVSDPKRPDSTEFKALAGIFGTGVIAEFVRGWRAS